jgi:hypothetical protein
MFLPELHALHGDAMDHTLTISISPRATPPSYQTAPLTDYSPALRRTAADLFDRVVQRVARGRAIAYKGSFSVLARSGQSTAAKIIVYEHGKGKPNGDWPLLSDGVYILIRAGGRELSFGRTIGVAPKHEERFAYVRLMPDQDLDEVADFIAACSNR